MSKEFFDTIKIGDLGGVEHLLSLDPSLIHEKDNGLSPIMVAAYSRKPQVTDFLSEKSGGLNIFESAATGRINQIARHLARDPMLVNAYACDGFQPLGLSCHFGRYETAVYLIKAGAVINSPSRNSLKVTPLHSAASAGHNNIILLLLNHDANPNAKDCDGFTALHTAAQKGNTPMIRTLLFNGADLTLRSHQGKLALDLAVEAGHSETVALLREGITRRFKAFRSAPVNIENI